MIEPPELIYERGEDGSMRALGEPSAVQLGEVMGRVLEVLGDVEWVKSGEVREMLGEPRPSLRQLQAVLVQLARDGKIERDPPISEESVRGKNVRFKRWSRS